MKNVLKKALCVMLSVMMAISVFSIVSFAADNGDLKLYVATDVHYVKPSQLGSVADAKVTVPQSANFFYADYMGKMFYEAEAIVYSLLSNFEASESNTLLICGDMTNGGDIASHEALAAIFKAFEVRTGKNILVIPGNHDIFNGDGFCSIEDFKRIYADFGYNEALTKHAESGSYTIDLNSKYRLLALDSNNYEKVAGEISESEMTWISEQVAKAKEDGVYLIGTMHHSLLDHFMLQSTFTGGFDAYSLETLAKTFANWGIKYMLTGHLHVTDITMATTQEGNKIYDIATGCLISSPNNYRIIDFTEKSVNVETKCIDKVDAKYLPEGYTKQQLDLLLSDFQAYSRDYCSDGLYYWVDSFLTVKKFGKSLGLKEGSTAYEAIEKLMTYVREAVKLPLYDNGTPEVDSLEEVAALAGYKLPESDYKYAVDIAAVFALGFFGGDGNIKSDSLDTTLILQAVEGAVAYALGQLIDEGKYTEALVSVFKKLGIADPNLDADNAFTTQLSKLMYVRSFAKAFVKSAISPLLESISFDAYAPEDLNVTLEPYGAAASNPIIGENGQPLTFFQKLISVLKYIINLFVKSFTNIL